MVTKAAKEIDVRVDVVNSILNTPHKNIDPLIPVHNAAEEGDPLFYIKMGIWYASQGSIRDHNKLFAAKILSSQYTEFRGVGEKLLSQMSTRDVAESITITEKHFKGKSGGVYRRIRRAVARVVNKIENISQNDNGIMLLRNAQAVRDLIVKFHLPIAHQSTAASLHFRSDSTATPYKAFDAIKEIAKPDTSEKHICTLIDKYRLPPLQVMGALKELTPAIAAAMLKGMSSAETVNFMKMFERKGLTKLPEFIKAVEKKVTTGKKSASASMRSMQAAKVLSDGGGAKAMEAVTDDFVRNLRKINKSVVLAIDKSFSMQEAIAVGKELATILAAVVVDPINNLNVCVYDNVASAVPVGATNNHSDFEARFRYIKANGTTSLGSVIKYIDKKDIQPDLIVFIGDADESDLPLLNDALKDSSNVKGSRLINCKVGNPVFDLKVSNEVIVAQSLTVDNVRYTGDYYSLPNIVKVITTGGIKDTIAEIDAISIEDFMAAAA